MKKSDLYHLIKQLEERVYTLEAHVAELEDSLYEDPLALNDDVN